MTHPFTINKREFLLCEVPIGSTKHQIVRLANHHNLVYWIEREPGNDEAFSIHLSENRESEYKLIGLYPGLTEIQAAGIMLMFHDIDGIPGYNDGKGIWSRAVDAFASKLQAEKIYIGENPFGKEPEMKDFEYEYDKEYQPEDDFDYDDMAYKSALRDWQEAEARTTKQAVILEIIK
jgi:hypothetical protein